MNTRYKKLIIDIAERSLNTFWQVFVGVWLASGLDMNSEILEAALWAALAAVLKGTIASQVGSPRTASLLPAGPDTDKG